MTLILNIETADKNCSVALAYKGKLVACIEKKNKEYLHSEQLHVFMEKVMQKAKKEWIDLNAVAVSEGPGSYTGLRIGFAAAKGICYGLKIPLITTKTLEALVFFNKEKVKTKFIVPLISSRKEENYMALYNKSNTQLTVIESRVLTSNLFKGIVGKEKITFIGPGVKKTRENKSFIFLSGINPSAKGMCELSFKKFKKQKQKEIAYIEPLYIGGAYS